MKSSENRENRGQLIHLKSHNIKSEIWLRSSDPLT